MHILKDMPVAVSDLLSELGDALEEFTSDTSADKLSTAMTLWRQIMPKLIAVTPIPGKEQTQGPFTKAATEAFGRLEKLIGLGIYDYCKEAVQKHGLAAAADEIFRNPIMNREVPDYGSEILGCVKACSKLSPESLDGPVKVSQGCLQSLLPRHVKLVSLETKFLKDVLPSQWEKMEAWIHMYEKSLGEWLKQQRSILDTALEAFQPFRLWALASKRCQCYICGSLMNHGSVTVMRSHVMINDD